MFRITVCLTAVWNVASKFQEGQIWKSAFQNMEKYLYVISDNMTQ